MTDLVLVLDAGTTGGRASLFDREGHTLASASEPWSYTSAGELVPRVTFDPHDWTRAFGRLVLEVLGGLDAQRVACVATTGQRMGCVAQGGDGEVLYAGPNLDVRGLEVATDSERLLDGRASLGRWPPWLFGSGRLVWLKRERADAFARLARVASIPGFLAAWLSGERTRIEDPSTAADLGFLDVTRGTWDGEALERVGLEPGHLGRVVACGDAQAQLSPALAERLGLRGELPVVVAGADTACALLGGGPAGVQDLIALGSTTPVVRQVEAPWLDPARRLWTSPSAVPGRWLVEASCGETGRLVDWFHAELGGGATVPELFAAAASVPPGSDGVRSCLGPRLQRLGELSLAANAGSIRVPVRTGAGSRPGRAAMFRALLENVAFAIRQCTLELDRRLEQPGAGAVRAVGGLARAGLMADLVAAALGRPVEVPQAEQATSLGAAMVGAAAAGLYGSLEEARAGMAPAVRRHEPDEDLADEYEDLYELWLEAEEQLAQS